MLTRRIDDKKALRSRWLSAVTGYLMAIPVLAGAVALRALLDPWLGYEVPLVTLFAGVAAAVWLGGYRPALLVAILGYLACDYLFSRPRGGFDFSDAGNLMGLLAYVVSCSLIIGFGERMRVAQRQAEEHRELLRITLASIGDAVISTDTQGRITYLNGVAELLTGFTLNEAVGQPLETVFRIVNEQTRQAVENPATRVIREGVIVGLANHTVLIRKDGTERPIEDSASPIRDERGGMAGCVLVFRDATIKRRTEEELRRQAERFRALVTATAQIIWTTDPDGWVTEDSSSWRACTGQSYAEWKGWGWLNVIHPEDRERAKEAWTQAVANRSIYVTEYRVRAKDGHYRWMAARGVPVLDQSGGIREWVGMNTDITDRKRVEEALREADRRKDEFLATLAHELRNPLAPIYNSLEIIKRADGDADTLREARDLIERQLAHMVRLVDDLLDVSRITRDKLELRKTRVELASIIHQAVEICRSARTGPEDQAFDVVLPEQPVCLDGDPVRLAQVFCNLLNNACKFTPRGGTIRLTAELRDSAVVVAVKDTGIGIPPGKLENIFEMFAQLDRALERAHGGLGIGLTLVKRLVEMHGGRIEARSEGLGRGSEFLVRLPILAEERHAYQPPAGTLKEQAMPRRILIVDDNKDSADSLAMLLRLSGHETRLAYDGVAAVEMAQQFRPNVVLLDIGLPKLNGYDACRQIREQPWGADIVMLALTGWGQEEDRRKSKKAGFDEHLVKPLDHAVFMKLLASLPLRGEVNSPDAPL